MAKQNSQVIWKLQNKIFTHPFHIKSSNEAYFSKYMLNCINTHPPVYQQHTADVFKTAVGDPKQWCHDKAVRMTTMGISATCFPDLCHLRYRPVFANQPLSVHINLDHTLMINHYCPWNNNFTRFHLFCFVLLLDVAVIQFKWSSRTPIVYDPLTFL